MILIITLKFQIEGEGGINGQAGKNTANRNFIEIKSSNQDGLMILWWKYQQKEHKKCKGSLSKWRITSKPEPVYAYKRHAYKKKHV